MKIQPLINQDNAFQGQFVRNQAWYNIRRYYNKTNPKTIQNFELYIKLIETHCPENSVYKFVKNNKCSETKGLFSTYTLFRNDKPIGEEYLRFVYCTINKAKDIIVKDSVGDIK